MGKTKEQKQAEANDQLLRQALNDPKLSTDSKKLISELYQDNSGRGVNTPASENDYSPRVGEVYIPRGERNAVNPVSQPTEVIGYGTIPDLQKMSHNPYVINDEEEVGYDYIKLPSRGLCYPNRPDRIKVAYLTAADEDIITSPNLYRDNRVIDEILRRKVIDPNINPDMLVNGDVDAILVWLRADGYGPNFPITATDPQTQEEFDTEINLGDLEFKDFSLTPDGNGFFDFELPLSHDKIKFRFLTRMDERIFSKYMRQATRRVKKYTTFEMIQDINDIIATDDDMHKDMRRNLNVAIKYLNEYADSVDENAEPITSSLTYRMISSIVSINGETDRAYIERRVKNMKAGDALAFRKYVTEHEPGIDFRVKVENPGGGSFETFLNLDPTILIYNA